MERAMSPDQKSKEHPDNLPHRGKATAALTKGHAGKSQPAGETTAKDAGCIPGNAGNNIKAKATSGQPDGSPAASKETTATDLMASLPTLANDTGTPLPVFLSLPLMEHPGAGNVEAEKMVLAGDFSAAQPTPATGVTKALPTITSGPAIAAVGKNTSPVTTPEKNAPEKSATKTTGNKSGMETLLPTNEMLPAESLKISTDVISPAALASGTKTPQSATDAKVVPPSTGKTGTLLESIEAGKNVTAQVGASITPSEPTKVEKNASAQAGEADTQAEAIKTEDHAMAHLVQNAPDLVTSAPARTDDKYQAVPPVTGNPAEPVKNNGTGVAITASSMKNSDKTNKVAGLDVQVLPGGTNGTSRETVLPAHATFMEVRSSEKQNQDFNLPLPSANPAPVDAPETAGIAALPSLTDARMRDVERTHDLVSINALRMVDSKSDSLQVVIKPGPGTELSLELRHRNGTVEAEAVLQRGDYQLMNQHWPELQAKLEQRGIKLAPLGSETSFSTAGNGNAGTGNFSRQQSSREEAAQQASAFAEFAVAMNRGGATARLAPAIAGSWESWA
jgi:hypothetical protein